MGHLQALIDDGHITDPGSARGKLLDKSARLFSEKGYERTTVRDIANDVGIQSGSIFHHFKSKEEILKAVMTESIILFTEKLRGAIESADSVEAKLLACIQSELDFTVGQDTVAAMSVLVSEWRCLSESHRPLIMEYRAQYEQLWMDVLAEAKAGGLIDGDVFIARRLLAGAIHWTPNWYHSDGELTLGDLAQATFELACGGKT
jgi:AcrR family transcriptional regulator